MASIILYTAPRTCAKVPLILLEEIGEAFETRIVNLPRGEHKAPAYRAINPKAKVPALEIDGNILTENAALVLYLHGRYPAAKLMPEAEDLLARTVQLADLFFCGTTLHPLVTRMCIPVFFAVPSVSADVQAKASEGLNEYFAIVEDRLSQGPWWYGDSWSAMDAYLYWIYWRVCSCGFDPVNFPRFADHARRMEARPAVRRAIAREAADLERLAADADAAGPIKS